MAMTTAQESPSSPGSAADFAATPSDSPWSYPIFRSVWVASLASNFGGLIQSVGAAWLMTTMTGSPQMVALVQASTTLPILLLSLFAGAVADNLDRRHVMLFAQSLMLLVSAALSLATWLGLLSPFLLLMFTFLIGCGTAINGPAWQASVGDMVERPALPSAVALNSMGFNIARSLGPALGGAIVAAAGAAAAFLTNVLSYIGLIFILARWRPERPPRTLPPERIDLAMAAGVRYVAMSPVIRLVLFRALLFGLSAAAISALLPLVARDSIRGGALTYGILLGGFGMGAVAGAIFVRWLRLHLKTEPMVGLATASFVVGTLLTGWSTSLLITIPGLMCAGTGWVVALSTFNVTVQLSTPRWVVARALALYQMFAFGGMAIGAWLFGVLAEGYGLRTSLTIAAAMQFVTIGIGFLRPLPVTLDANLSPLGGWHRPDIAVPLQNRSGPIIIEIGYRIREEDIPAFLAAMGERRRIRRRDGARQWTLLRDLADPGLWTERYSVATWIDYQRHIERRTEADAANIGELRKLHQGPDLPTIHRRIERDVHALPWPGATSIGELPRPATDEH